MLIHKVVLKNKIPCRNSSDSDKENNSFIVLKKLHIKEVIGNVLAKRKTPGPPADGRCDNINVIYQ